MFVSIIAQEDWTRDSEEVRYIFGVPTKSDPRKEHSYKSNTNQPHLSKTKYIDDRKPCQLRVPSGLTFLEHKAPRQDIGHNHSDQISDHNGKLVPHDAGEKDAEAKVADSGDSSRNGKTRYPESFPGSSLSFLFDSQ